MRLVAFRAISALSACVLIASCAKRPDEIHSAYVSPIIYDSYTCEQIAAEAQRVSARASEAMGIQQQKAGNDTAAVAIGLVLFWPALLFVKGNGATEAEVAQLKGQMEALEQASIQKQCGLTFQRPEPPIQKRPPARHES